VRLLVDTDILIDLALKREPFVEDAAILLDMLEANPGSACIAWHTASNFYYLVAGKRGGDQSRQFLYDLSRFVAIAPTTTDHLRVAVKLPMSGFEDAMQVSAALAWNADFVVTRNRKDFMTSPIPAISPAEAIKRLSD
jgi:predicted nucleic acid-binding protein